MAINEQSPDFRGLAALANMQVPNLNLPLHGANYGEVAAQALFHKAQLQEQYASQANELVKTQMFNQGTLNAAKYKAYQDALQKQLEFQHTDQQNALNRQNDQDVANINKQPLMDRNQLEQVRLQQEADRNTATQGHELNMEQLRSQEVTGNQQIAKDRLAVDQEKSIHDEALDAMKMRAQWDKDNRTNRGALGANLYQIENDPNLSEDEKLKRAKFLIEQSPGTMSAQEEQGYLKLPGPYRKLMAAKDVMITGGSDTIAKSLTDTNKKQDTNNQTVNTLQLDIANKTKVLTQINNFNNTIGAKLGSATKQYQGFIGGIEGKFEAVLPTSMQSAAYKNVSKTISEGRTQGGLVILSMLGSLKQGRSAVASQILKDAYTQIKGAGSPEEIQGIMDQATKAYQSDIDVDRQQIFDLTGKYPVDSSKQSNAASPTSSPSTAASKGSTTQTSYVEPGQSYSQEKREAIIAHNKALGKNITMADVDKALANGGA